MELPKWITSNDWLSKNQEKTFVKRLRNTASQIEGDKFIKKPSHSPMEATSECLWGDVAVKGTCFQWAETKKEYEKLSETDKIEAKKILDIFKNEYSEYISILET